VHGDYNLPCYMMFLSLHVMLFLLFIVSFACNLNCEIKYILNNDEYLQSNAFSDHLLRSTAIRTLPNSFELSAAAIVTR